MHLQLKSSLFVLLLFHLISFHVLFSSLVSNIPRDFFFDKLVVLRVLFNFYIFVNFLVFLWMLISIFIPSWWEKILLCDFSLLKFLRSVAYYMSVLEEGSMSTWEERLTCCCSVECPRSSGVVALIKSATACWSIWVSCPSLKSEYRNCPLLW